MSGLISRGIKFGPVFIGQDVSLGRFHSTVIIIEARSGCCFIKSLKMLFTFYKICSFDVGHKRQVISVPPLMKLCTYNKG